jgi:hypothetical protein
VADVYRTAFVCGQHHQQWSWWFLGLVSVSLAIDPSQLQLLESGTACRLMPPLPPPLPFLKTAMRHFDFIIFADHLVYVRL